MSNTITTSPITGILSTRMDLTRSASKTDQNHTQAVSPPKKEAPAEAYSETLMFNSEKSFLERCLTVNSEEEATDILGIDLTTQACANGGMCSIYKTEKYPQHIVRVVPLNMLSLRTLSRGQLCQTIASQNNLAPKIKSFIKTKTHCFILMEHIQGPTLKEWEMNKELTFKDYLETFLDLTKKMQTLYNLNIVHGDLASDNMILRTPEKEVILIDFDFSLHLDKSTSPFIEDPRASAQTRQETYDDEIINLGKILLSFLTKGELALFTTIIYEIQTYLTENLKDIRVSHKHLQQIATIIKRLCKYNNRELTYPKKLNLEPIIQELEFILAELENPSSDQQKSEEPL